MSELDKIYEELDNITGGDIEPDEEMTLEEVIQYLENKNTRILKMIEIFKKARIQQKLYEEKYIHNESV